MGLEYSYTFTTIICSTACNDSSPMDGLDWFGTVDFAAGWVDLLVLGLCRVSSSTDLWLSRNPWQRGGVSRPSSLEPANRTDQGRDVYLPAREVRPATTKATCCLWLQSESLQDQVVCCVSVW